MFRIGRDMMLIDDIKSLSKEWYKEYIHVAKPAYSHLRYPKNESFKSGDHAIFVFGEIDVRAHILKQVERQNKPVADIVYDLVTTYVQAIHKNKIMYPDVHLIIQSVMPPTSRENVTELSKDYPDYGTIDDRIFVNSLVNNSLKNECHKHGIQFLDTTSYYENDESPWPMHGLAPGCSLGEMDNRTKDANVHVDIEHPEGYVIAMQEIGIPSNINIKPYRKTCKYPIHMNYYQRELYQKLATVHQVWVICMLLSLVVPSWMLPYSVGLYILTVILNLFVAEGTCIWAFLEFRVSNCNDTSFVAQYLDAYHVPRKYQKMFVQVCYVLMGCVLAWRMYNERIRKGLV
jgi:hypothetical protein